MKYTNNIFYKKIVYGKVLTENSQYYYLYFTAMRCSSTFWLCNHDHQLMLNMGTSQIIQFNIIQNTDLITQIL